jgi:hypothetical protein
MASTRRNTLATARRAGLLVLVNVVLLVVLFALVEGAASLLFIGHEIAHTRAVPEHQHAEHDELLGWVNLPNVDLPDMYGPGVAVRTNGQRFRNDNDFTAAVPAGRTRVICSGDSFTFGYGVDNKDTWCERLVALEPRLETVNMGLGGYGVDQAYLWYMRDGAPLDHDLHLFVFLTDDFRRMRSDRFMGYGKPFLDVRDDSLVVANMPVPETSWLARRRALHGETVARLNVVRLARRLLRLDDASRVAERHERARLADQRLHGIVARMFEELQRANAAKDSRLVLVFLPGAWDYKPDPSTDAWREFVGRESARQGIVFLDLVEEIRQVPPTEVDALYAPNAHFSVRGNAWAAAVLHRLLAPLLDDARAGGTDAAREPVSSGEPAAATSDTPRQ